MLGVLATPTPRAKSAALPSPTRLQFQEFTKQQPCCATIWKFPIVKSLPSVKMGQPILPPKLSLPEDRFPNPTICLIHGPIRLTTLNGIRIRSAVFPQPSDRQTHRRTQRQTNRWLSGKFDDYRPLSLYRRQRGLTMTQSKLQQKYRLRKTRHE